MGWTSIVRMGVILGAGLSLCGCLSAGSIQERAETINRSLESAQNQAILLNVVRASRAEPLYFESINVVHGVGQEDLKIGLPGLTLGPGKANPQRQFVFGGSASNVIDSQIQTSFDVGVLNSKNFYAGMMTPLGLDEANLLFSQGYSRELVLYLLIDSVRITDVTDLKAGDDERKLRATVLFNDPARPGYREADPNAPALSFERLIREAMTHGLTTEAYAEEKAPPSSPTTTQAMGGAPGVSVVVVQPAPTQPQGGGVHARLCYDFSLTTADAMNDFVESQKAYPSEASQCGSSKPREQSSKIPVFLGHRRYIIEVRFRSIFGIFDYLGRLVNADPALVTLRDYGIANEPITPAPLLTITRRETRCFSKVRYAGQAYCVPDSGAENTTRVFAILNELLALKTSPGDLPTTQTVRVTP